MTLLFSMGRFLALQRNRAWSRATISGCVASLRSFFRFAKAQGWCGANVGNALDARRLYTTEGLPAGPSWNQVQQLIKGIGR
jgi:site-specific recombinase XerD